MFSSKALFSFCLLAVSGLGSASAQTASQCDEWISNEGVYQGHYSPACKVLTTACFNNVRDNLTTQLWDDHVCVAAATCQGTEKTVGIAGCMNPEIASLGHQGFFLTQDVWNQNIATYCLSAPPRCPIDQQYYIDFIYRTLDELGSDVWPDAQTEVIDIWWDALLDWAGSGTGGEVIYGQFNDWLRNSHSE